MASYRLTKKARIVNKEVGYDYSKGDLIEGKLFTEVCKSHQAYFEKIEEKQLKKEAENDND